MVRANNRPFGIQAQEILKNKGLANIFELIFLGILSQIRISFHLQSGRWELGAGFYGQKYKMRGSPKNISGWYTNLGGKFPKGML